MMNRCRSSCCRSSPRRVHKPTMMIRRSHDANKENTYSRSHSRYEASFTTHTLYVDTHTRAHAHAFNTNIAGHLNHARKYNVTDTRYFLDDRHCTTVSLTYMPRGTWKEAPGIIRRGLPYQWRDGTHQASGKTSVKWFTPSLVTRLHWCATRRSARIRCPLPYKVFFAAPLKRISRIASSGM